MTLEGQRSHIRRFFPALFVDAASRDIRNFIPGMSEFDGLRSTWMSARLCRMGEILRDRSLTMAEYTADLRRFELLASADNPMPALDVIVRDHRATGWKTLSVFVRDCVGGNCFPIDSRVEKELHRSPILTRSRSASQRRFGAGLPVRRRVEDRALQLSPRLPGLVSATSGRSVPRRQAPHPRGRRCTRTWHTDIAGCRCRNG